MTPKDPFTRDIKVGEDWAIPNANGVGRRVIVQGAVWTVPVVAFATNASAAAASGNPTLEFVNGPYTATACQPLGTIILKATTDGTAPAINETVMVTPPAGMTWANDGSSGPRGFQTDVNGEATVTGLDAGGVNGSYVLNASTAAASDSETVVVTGATSTVFANGINIGALPAGVTAVDIQTTNQPDGSMVVTVLGSNGIVYQKNSAADGSTFAAGAFGAYASSGVTHFALTSLGTGTRIAWVSGNEVFANGTSIGTLPAGVTGVDIQTTNQPDGSMVVTVLGSDGHIYQKNSPANGTTFPAGAFGGAPSSGVTHFALSSNGGGTRIAWVSGNEVFANGTSIGTLPAGVTGVDIQTTNQPDGSMVVSVLGSDGHVYQKNSAANGTTFPAGAFFSYPSSSGVAHFALSSLGTGTRIAWVSGNEVFANGTSIGTLPAGVTGVDIQTTNQPDGSMVVSVLGSDGRIYQKNSAPNGSTFPAGAFGGNYPSTGAINDFALTSTGAGTRIAYTAASC